MGLRNCDDQIWFGFHGAGCTQNLLHAITLKQPIHQNNLGLGTALSEMGGGERLMMKAQDTLEWRLSAICMSTYLSLLDWIHSRTEETYV